jgi:hypothetical protein
MNCAFKTAKQFHLKTESSAYSIISGLNFIFRKQVPCCFTLTSIDKVQDTRPKIGYGITADINNTQSDFQLPSSNSNYDELQCNQFLNRSVKKQNWSESATVLWEQKNKEKRESRVPRTLTGSISIA